MMYRNPDDPSRKDLSQSETSICNRGHSTRAQRIHTQVKAQDYVIL